MQDVRPLVLVSGKGGVGKSVMAAAYALNLSRKGKKVLLVEFGGASFYEKFLQTEVGFEPKIVKENLSIVSLSAIKTLEEYIGYLIRIKKLAHLFFQNKPMKALINAAPALKELAIMGKLTSHIRHHGPEMPYDCLVVDAYATGHFLSLLRAPFGMYEAVKVGPMGKQCKEMMRVIQDEKLVQIINVTLPEVSPTQELIELHSEIKKEFNQTPLVVVNQLLPKMNFSCENEFTEFYNSKDKIQEICHEKLKALSIDTLGVPFIPSLDAWELIDEVAYSLADQ